MSGPLPTVPGCPASVAGTGNRWRGPVRPEVLLWQNYHTRNDFTTVCDHELLSHFMCSACNTESTFLQDKGLPTDGPGPPVSSRASASSSHKSADAPSFRELFHLHLPALPFI